MIIGIAYDTKDMYNNINDIYNDFADKNSILSLKRELEHMGYEVVLLGNAQNIIKLLKEDNFCCDIVYNTVEGISSRNREGIIPSLLEANNIPYIGTDAFGLSLTLNKYFMKVLATNYNILTPNSVFITKNMDSTCILNELNCLKYPIIIKPNYEGNSSGIAVCDTKTSAFAKIENISKLYKTDILCEEFIFGQEITIPYIDIAPDGLWDVTTVDVQKSNDFWLDVNWKVYGDYNNLVLDLDPKIKNKFENITKTLFNIIGCHDFCRFDFRMTPQNEIYFIEANPLPALFSGGSFDVVGKKYGYTYAETIELIIKTACNRLSIPRI